MICYYKLLIVGKNLGAGATKEGDKKEGIEGKVDHYVLLHHQDVIHLLLLLLLFLLLLLKCST